MAKRHYGKMSKDARHEMRHEARYDLGHYEGHSDRRRQEMMDAGMISEDRHAIANLPQNVMIKAYPKNGSYLPANLDDTLRGIDRQVDLDDSRRDKHFMPKKV